MIIPSMTEQEICKEMHADIDNLQMKVEACRKDFRSRILRTSKFPLNHSYEYITPKKNLFVIAYSALKRGQHDNPNLGIYCIYSRPEGKYAAVRTVAGRITIFAPHFFVRYQKRILKDDSLLQIEVIKRYFSANMSQVSLEINDEVEAVFKCFEGHYSDEVVSLVSATSEGYCFGEDHGNVSIMKTIITEDMLSDRQKQLFPSIRELFIQVNKALFGPKWSPEPK